ncbi:MAG: hypothetical protein R2824_19700 [Saprospiraceae bacterium]|nr:hypothetical protein [Lewinella sp.]
MSLYPKIKDKLLGPGFYSRAYIPQFRLEGRSRNPDNEDALAMRIADPLWMLGRQWQFGEFRAEDNGSPVGVVGNYHKEKLGHYSLGGSTARQPVKSVPVEARVEAMAVGNKDLRSKVRIGQKFESMIRRAYNATDAPAMISAVRQKYPLQEPLKADERSLRFFKLMSGKVIDGGILLDAINAKQFAKGAFLELASLADHLKNWYRDLFLPPAADSAWKSHQLLHEFGLHKLANDQTDELTLSAPDYQNGHLDWYSFDKAQVGIDPAQQSKQTEPLMPVNVSFAAMPDNRLFSFEDSRINLTDLDVDTTDLLKLLLIDFSLVSGSDWYSIPLKMELGEACWINYLEVTDVFGVHTRIQNSQNVGVFLDENGLQTWDIFKIRDQNIGTYHPRDHFLFLAPATTFRMESRPLEELLFLRDEFANMVWAIERTVRNEMGTPTDGYDLHLELNGPFLKETEETTGNETMPHFRLAAPVPTNWIPYLPFHLNTSQTEIELRQAMMIRNEANTDPVDIPPLSVLAGEDIPAVREEAIPRAGVRVQITRQRVRWTDGKTYIWQGRKVLAGRGEGNSGLSFDQLLV